MLWIWCRLGNEYKGCMQKFVAGIAEWHRIITLIFSTVSLLIGGYVVQAWAF